MYNQTSNKNHSFIDLIVPAYGFYDRMGAGLAEGLVNILEKFFGLVARIRR